MLFRSVICTSGNFRPSNRELGVTYMQKPFTSQDLLRVVKEAFQKPAPGEARPPTEAKPTAVGPEEPADSNSAMQVGQS